MSDPIEDQLIVEPFEYGQHTINMVYIKSNDTKFEPLEHQ